MNLKETIFKKIEDGLFVSTFCTLCKKYNWPPSIYCKECFGKTKLKKIKNIGILLEISYSHITNEANFFGIGDFSGIRILGTANKSIRINDSIEIDIIKVMNNKISIVFNKSEKK
jgi:uncharacterized OB-fold protein